MLQTYGAALFSLVVLAHASAHWSCSHYLQHSRTGSGRKSENSATVNAGCHHRRCREMAECTFQNARRPQGRPSYASAKQITLFKE